MLYFYCTNDVDVQGPVPVATLKDMYSARQLPPETKVCAEGASEWCGIQLVLRTLIATPAPPPLRPKLPANFKKPVEQVQPVKSVSSTSKRVLWIPATILGVITAGLIVWPIAAYVEQEELSGRLHPPDWLVRPVAFGFIGFCLFFSSLYFNFFDKRSSRKK